MSLLQVNGLSHSFGEKELYKQASFSLHKGEHMGIVGQNGTGKSTLLKILLGEIAPSEGQIQWQTDIDIGHIDQYANINGNDSIDMYLHTAFAHLYEIEQKLQSLYMQMQEDTSDKKLKQAVRYQEYLDEHDFYAIDTSIARVATGLGLPAIGMDRPLCELSGGQRTKVMLAKLLLDQSDVLLLDEPTNFLDTEHITWLCEYLSSFAGSFMIVSHNFDFLERITTCICDIEFQSIKKYHGKYSDFVRQKTQRREDYVRQYHAQQRETQRLEEYIQKNKVRASTARMAQSRQKQLDRIQRLAPPSVLPKPNIVFDQIPFSTARALTIHDLIVGYDTPLLPKLRLSIDGGKKIVITGFNGIGKSTLLKTLVGAIPNLEGKFEFSPSARIGYFEQDLHWEDHSKTPLQLLYDEYPKLPIMQIRRELARCGVSAKHAMQSISSLSGGEQNKVKLCRLTLKTCNFLILDEPTNHLDAETKDSLRQAIIAYQGTVLLVCHETAFYHGWVDGVINIENYLHA